MDDRDETDGECGVRLGLDARARLDVLENALAMLAAGSAPKIAMALESELRAAIERDSGAGKLDPEEAARLRAADVMAVRLADIFADWISRFSRASRGLPECIEGV